MIRLWWTALLVSCKDSGVEEDTGQARLGCNDLFYLDADGDSWGDEDHPIRACTVPSGYSEVPGDCDDDAPDVNPDALEYCDGIDNNCRQGVDEVTAVDAGVWYPDEDGDGYGDPNRPNRSCQAFGRTQDNTDCNDSSTESNPGAEEICDDLDNDCDGVADGTFACVESNCPSGTAAQLNGENFGTIQAAITSAATGETISICNGLHTEHLTFSRNGGLILRALSSEPGDTALDGLGTGPILTLTGGGAVEIRNLTFVNGLDAAVATQGSWDGDLSIASCVFEGTAGGYAVQFQPTGSVARALAIDNTTFLDNYSPLLAAGSIDQITIQNSVFEENDTASELGSSAQVTAELTSSRWTHNSGGILFHATDRSTLRLVSATLDTTARIDREPALKVTNRGTTTVELTDCTFVDNEAGALDLDIGAYSAQLRLENTAFSGSSRTAIQASTGGLAVRMVSSSITGNDGGEGGADLGSEVTFSCKDCNWGTGEDDNAPHDLTVNGESYDDLGEGESFSCTPGDSCH